MFEQKLEDFETRLLETLRGMDDIIKKENLEMDTGEDEKQIKKHLMKLKPNPSYIGNGYSINPHGIKST